MIKDRVWQEEPRYDSEHYLAIEYPGFTFVDPQPPVFEQSKHPIADCWKEYASIMSLKLLTSK